jgi:DNA polymerase
LTNTLAEAGKRETVRLIGESLKRIGSITGLENPNSVQQIHPWLKERGYKYESLGKEFLRQSEGDELTAEARETVALRLGAAKSSVKKFTTLVEQTSLDNRLRNQFVYGGAHTFAGPDGVFSPRI